MVVPLKQTQRGWTMDEDKLVIGGISKNAPQVEGKQSQWRGAPKPNGKCRVYVSEGVAYLNWGGEDHINSVSAADFLTQNILTGILGENYKHSVVNSNETYAQGEGTKAFIDYAKAHGFDLEDYDAKTWQIYAKTPDGKDFLNNPAIYWSTVELTNEMVQDPNVKIYVPVLGYRNGKYDVYRAPVVQYNSGKTTQYLSISNNFANITNESNGGSATFQFDKYEDAKKEYDKLMTQFQQNGTVSNVNGL